MRNRLVCLLVLSLMVAVSPVRGQDAVRSTSEVDAVPANVTADGAQLDTEAAETERVVVSATRFDIPLDQSPASASVITSQEIEVKQIERVSDALR